MERPRYGTYSVKDNSMVWYDMQAMETTPHALREERYRTAEARLTQSFQRCHQEPSVWVQQIRGLENTVRTLQQFAEDAERQAKQLASIITDRSASANMDPERYRLMLCQRWHAEKRRDLILQYVDIVQQAVISLRAGRDKTILPDHEESQVSGTQPSANLVAFLRSPHRVLPLRQHHRPQSSIRAHLRPLFSVAQPRRTQVDNCSTSDTETLIAPSVIEQHMESIAEDKASQGEAGTALIFNSNLSPLKPIDPSDIEVALPAYVHDLLADFDANMAGQSAASVVKFKDEETSSASLEASDGAAAGRSHGTPQPKLYSKSSFRRLSHLFSNSEARSSRKKSTVKTEESSTGSGAGDNASQTLSSSSSSLVGRVTSKIGRRISFVNMRR